MKYFFILGKVYTKLLFHILDVGGTPGFFSDTVESFTSSICQLSWCLRSKFRNCFFRTGTFKEFSITGELAYWVESLQLTGFAFNGNPDQVI